MAINRNKYSGKKILVVTAHPDDETFGMGGTLAFYAQQGAEVNLVCATRGEAGDVPEDMLKEHQSIGALREHELRCAAEILGIHEVLFLDYRDSGMEGSDDNNHPDAFINAPVEKVAEKIMVLIRRIRPEVVITFDPVGGYFHPDHIAAHKATVRAFGMAPDAAIDGQGLAPFQPGKLYFHIIPKKFIRFIVRLLPLFGVDPTKFGRNTDIDLKRMLSVDFPIHAKVNYRTFNKLREQASACYASQGGDQQSGFLFTWLMRFFNPVEMYMCAYPEVGKKKIERDLLRTN